MPKLEISCLHYFNIFYIDLDTIGGVTTDGKMIDCKNTKDGKAEDEQFSECICEQMTNTAYSVEDMEVSSDQVEIFCYTISLTSHSDSRVSDEECRHYISSHAHFSQRMPVSAPRMALRIVCNFILWLESQMGSSLCLCALQ